MDMKGNKFTYKGEEEKFIEQWNQAVARLKSSGYNLSRIVLISTLENNQSKKNESVEQ